VISTPPDQLLTNRRGVKTLKDLKGMKIATGQDIGLETLKALGATATFIPAPDMYTALERGVIDGLATNWEKAFVFKEYQVTKYRTEAFLWTNPMPIFMNLDAWNSLPEGTKKAIEEVSGLAYSRKAGAIFDEAEKRAKAKIEEEDLKKGRGRVYTIPADEMKRWIEKTSVVYEKWIKECEAKGVREASTILKDARELASAYERSR
jgi:TRAP-type C4-dicarboxylate transport system substrate-binding protein